VKISSTTDLPLEEVVALPPLSPLELLVYEYVKKFPGRDWRGLVRVIEKIGVPRARAVEALKSLVKSGLVVEDADGKLWPAREAVEGRAREGFHRA